MRNVLLTVGGVLFVALFILCLLCMVHFEVHRDPMGSL